MSLFIDRYSLVLILIGILFLLIVAIIVLFKLQNRKKPQGSIPGVEEMAKTMFFWSDYHRGKIGKDEKD